MIAVHLCAVLLAVCLTVGSQSSATDQLTTASHGCCDSDQPTSSAIILDQLLALSVLRQGTAGLPHPLALAGTVPGALILYTIIYILGRTYTNYSHLWIS